MANDIIDDLPAPTAQRESTNNRSTIWAAGIHDDTVNHLQWMFRFRDGYICLGFLDRADGEMKQEFPRNIPAAIAFIERVLEQNINRTANGKPEIEVFYCPLRLKSKERHKGNTVDKRRVVWVDMDAPNPTARVTLREWGFRIIESGTPGHFHAYAYLDRDLPLHQHRAIQEKLARKFGGDNALKSDQPLLRLPGTISYKNHHPKPEKRNPTPMPVVLAEKGKRSISAVWLVRQLGGIKDAAVVHHVVTDGWEDTPRPTQIPDRVARFLYMDGSEGYEDWSGQAFAAVQTCVEANYTDPEIHVLMEGFKPGHDKYNGRWHRQIDHMIQLGRAKQQIKDQAEQGFWTCRAWINHARRYAQSKGFNPKAAVGLALLNAVLDTPPYIMLPNRGSLNMYQALVGPSGAGKGEAMDHSRLMIEYSVPVDRVGAGSGQALPHLFRKFDKKTGIWEPVATRAHYDIDEVDTYATLTGKDSLLDGYLRSAWTGRMLSAKYVDETKNVHVPEHSYRLCLTIGVQPMRADVLTSREAGGTPQRFLWLPVVDPEILDEPAACPGRISKPDRDFREGDEITLPEWISAELWADKKRRAQKGLRGTGEGGHAMLLRSKVAAAFALMDGRLDVVDEDWELSGVVIGWSDETYREVKSIIGESTLTGAANRGRMKAHENIAAKDTEHRDGVNRAKARVESYLTDRDWVKKRMLAQACRRTAEWLDEALEELIREGSVRRRKGPVVKEEQTWEYRWSGR